MQASTKAAAATAIGLGTGDSPVFTKVNGLTLTATTGTFTLTNGKTIAVTNSLTLSGTDGSTLNVGAGGTLGTAAFAASSSFQPAGSYLTANQTITLSGDITGSGSTGISTAIGAGKVTNSMLAGSIDLTSKVTGVLPLANGGTAGATAIAATISLVPASLSISTSAIDWSAATSLYKTLGANTTFTFSNVKDGETIVVALTNTTSNYTVTWPTVSWPSATAPTQTVGAHTDVYTFTSINSVIYGSVVQNF